MTNVDYHGQGTAADAPLYLASSIVQQLCVDGMAWRTDFSAFPAATISVVSRAAPGRSLFDLKRRQCQAAFISRAATAAPGDDDENDDEEVEPGKMRVSEIKAELDLREVAYVDCFDKESLVQRLQEARATGKADPSILQRFNKQKLEKQFNEEKRVELRNEDIDAAVANDGTLPGGLTPDTFKKLTGNPEIMLLLQSTKMQEAMTLMMTGGRDELERKMKDDPELQETVQKLDGIMKSLSNPIEYPLVIIIQFTSYNIKVDIEREQHHKKVR